MGGRVTGGSPVISIICDPMYMQMEFDITRKLSAARINSRFGSAWDNADGASGAINVKCDRRDGQTDVKVEIVI